jgi:hypothetical protein
MYDILTIIDVPTEIQAVILSNINHKYYRLSLLARYPRLQFAWDYYVVRIC